MRNNFSSTQRIYKTKRVNSIQSKKENSQKMNSVHSSKVRDQYFIHHDSSKFSRRLDKVCPNIRNKGDKELNILLHEVQKLNKQVQKRDKIILDFKDKNFQSKQYESQLVQLYRIIHFYQGKIGLLQNNLEQYEALNNSNLQPNNYQQLISEYRKQNAQLKGQLEQKVYQIATLENKIRKISIKYQETTKRGFNRNAKSSRGLQQSNISIDSRKTQGIKDKSLIETKQKNYNNFYTKVSKIQQQLQKFRQQYQSLSAQLQHQMLQNTKILKQNSSLKIKLQQKNQQKKIKIPKAMLNEIKKPEKYLKQRQSTRSSKTVDDRSQLSAVNQPKTLIPQAIVRKLRYNLMRSGITYYDLINVLTIEDNATQILCQLPYDLLNEEAQLILKQVKNWPMQQTLNMISENIPKYTNISLRCDNKLSIQLSNVFKNRQQQIQQILQDTTVISYSKLQKLLKTWGMNTDQIDFVCLKSYEDSSQVNDVNFEVIAQFFLDH